VLGLNLYASISKGSMIALNCNGLKSNFRRKGPPSLRLICSYIASLMNSLCSLHRRFIYSRNSYISVGAKVLGWRRIFVGKNSCISSGTTILANRTDSGPECFRIENNAFVGRNCFFSCGRMILIKDYALVSHGTMLIGASHNYDNILVPRISSQIVDLGSIIVGVNVFLGAGSVVIGNVTIGYGSVVAAGSVVRHSIPPLCVYAGSPAKLVRYFDPESDSWIKSTHLTRNESLLIDESTYLAAIAYSHGNIYLPLNYSRFAYSDL